MLVSRVLLQTGGGNGMGIQTKIAGLASVYIIWAVITVNALIFML